VDEKNKFRLKNYDIGSLINFKERKDLLDLGHMAYRSKLEEIITLIKADI
jgi:hypothetical protein